MRKIYNKNELNFALIWIGIYVVLMSVGDSISGTIGIAKILTAPICIILTLIVYLWIRKHNLKEKYGLCSFDVNVKEYLYFIPLVFLASTNLWWGFKLNLTVAESALYVISMLCVGFLEEIIFRGFLFKAMCKTNIRRAIIISSVTFGFGHIVNLLNGRDIPETLMQICYAVAIGFLFTIIFYKGKSLWPCIITHSVINSLSAFANTEDAPIWHGIAGSFFLCVVSLAYAVYIIYKTKEEKE
ncbi:MAG: CPBP family intramembrane metalloprotease [Lachnospiraceae bacterium]|nr:CPBP family intramembrane metalloprotease [Lachnospiraceae bacterium]